jgi:hypothetical protein
MATGLSITADWETLDAGSEEERACFAAVGIQADGVWLTEGNDIIANRLRQAPLLSAYHLAEWLAWNWWRLRWEPRSKSSDWAFAHCLSTIGSGYIWPNITVFSDGERIALSAKPTDERRHTAFRYITDYISVVSALSFETQIDQILDQVLERLNWASLPNSNLAVVWADVCRERQTPALSAVRKLEALLGVDPDEADKTMLEQLSSDAAVLGLSSVEELAAEHGQSQKILTSSDLRNIAESVGFDSAPRNAVSLKERPPLPQGEVYPAWHVGARAAQALRRQEDLNGKSISDKLLTEMAGVKAGVLSGNSSDLSFALDESPLKGRVALRSRWHQGRRFELARILGDRIAGPKGGRLFPATRAYTYRQKVQRSFAAEFLSPFEAVDEMLEGDYSAERQQDVAAHFDVSPLTIRTLLLNHRRLERDDFDEAVEPLLMQANAS